MTPPAIPFLKTREAQIVLAVFAASALCGAIYAWAAGQDVNWDWQNYHDYAVWALFNGRHWIDVAPANLQSFFNPAVLLFDFALRSYLPMPLGAIIAGAVQATSIAFVWCIAARICKSPVQAAAATLIAASAPMFLSEVGTSLTDVITAIPVLAGFLMLVSASRERPGIVLAAGFLIGFAAGLKLTNAVYGAGALATVLICCAAPLRSAVWLGIGGAVGVLIAGGPWAVVMWREFGNPLFPLYNGIFGAPEGKPGNFFDKRFLPDGILDWISYPFRWAAGDHPSAETSFRDARFAAAAVLGAVAIAVRLVRRENMYSNKQLRLFVFLAVSYLAWSYTFSIQRYAIVLELLSGVAIVVLLDRLIARFKPAPVIAVALCIAVWTKPADWGHRAWAEAVEPARLSAHFSEPAVFLVLRLPVGYLARHLPEGSRFLLAQSRQLALGPESSFGQRINDTLGDPHEDRLWSIGFPGGDRREEALAGVGLIFDESRDCITVDEESRAVVRAVEFCPLRRQ